MELTLDDRWTSVSQLPEAGQMTLQLAFLTVVRLVFDDLLRLGTYIFMTSKTQKNATLSSAAKNCSQDGSIPAIPYKFVAIGELGPGAQLCQKQRAQHVSLNVATKVMPPLGAPATSWL